MFSKNVSCEIPHSKHISKIYIFYIKNGNFLMTKSDLNIHQKRTKLHHLKKISRGSMPSNPSSNAHGLLMRSMSLCDMQISQSVKKILGPNPLPNPSYADELF